MAEVNTQDPVSDFFPVLQLCCQWTRSWGTLGSQPLPCVLRTQQWSEQWPTSPAGNIRSGIVSQLFQLREEVPKALSSSRVCGRAEVTRQKMQAVKRLVMVADVDVKVDRPLQSSQGTRGSSASHRPCLWVLQPPHLLPPCLWLVLLHYSHHTQCLALMLNALQMPLSASLRTGLWDEH